jgi:ATP-dependent RNA helicase RhlE
LLDGRDLLGSAQTGTGKDGGLHAADAAAAVRPPAPTGKGAPRALVLAPTRELAAQIGESIETYGRYLKVSHTVIFGGVGQAPQVKALNRGVDIVVATPGRCWT